MNQYYEMRRCRCCNGTIDWPKNGSTFAKYPRCDSCRMYCLPVNQNMKRTSCGLAPVREIMADVSAEEMAAIPQICDT